MIILMFFWDDSFANVKSARSVGMHAEVFTAFEKYKSKMSDIFG